MKIKSLVILAGFLVSCGENNNGSKQDAASASGQMAYLTAVNGSDDLPSCTSEIDGRILFVKSESKFYSCTAQSWGTIDLQGGDGKDGEGCTVEDVAEGVKIKCGSIEKIVSDGANGKDGTDGVQGIPGVNGTDNRIVKTLFCGGSIDSSNAQGLSVGSGLLIEYWVSILSSGDTYISASISNASIQTSGSNFYSKFQNGAASLSVTITDDYYGSMDGGWWELFVNVNTNIPSATFNNTSLPITDTRTWTFTTCQVHDFS